MLARPRFHTDDVLLLLQTVQRVVQLMGSAGFLAIVRFAGPESEEASYRPVWYTLVLVAVVTLLAGWSIPKEAAAAHNTPRARAAKPADTSTTDEEDDEREGLLARRRSIGGWETHSFVFEGDDSLGLRMGHRDREGEGCSVSRAVPFPQVTGIVPGSQAVSAR